MAVTAQQIAELAGVSRGTVDRALHHRGRVNPEVAARIFRIATELGYKPNLIRQALVKTKHDFKIGAIVQSAETPTMKIVLEGLKRAAEELRASGIEVIIRELSGLDEELLLENIEDLVLQGVQGLAISPNNTPELRQCIDQLDQQNIPVVTFNSDVPGSKRICFIGMNNYRGGQTAAGLMCQMIPVGSKVFPLTGHLSNTAHNNRLNSFCETLQQETDYGITVLPFQPCFDRDDYAYEITHHILSANPDVAGVYVAANGQQGVCQAIDDLGLKRRVKVVAFDLNAITMELLQSESLSCVLDQKAFEQGYRSPYVLYEYVTHQKNPPSELIYTDIAIRTKYNSDLEAPSILCANSQSPAAQ